MAETTRATTFAFSTLKSTTDATGTSIRGVATPGTTVAATVATYVMGEAAIIPAITFTTLECIANIRWARGTTKTTISTKVAVTATGRASYKSRFCQLFI